MRGQSRRTHRTARCGHETRCAAGRTRGRPSIDPLAQTVVVSSGASVALLDSTRQRASLSTTIFQPRVAGRSATTRTSRRQGSPQCASPTWVARSGNGGQRVIADPFSLGTWRFRRP